jgi:hypothetical protein
MPGSRAGRHDWEEASGILWAGGNRFEKKPTDWAETNFALMVAKSLRREMRNRQPQMKVRKK